MNTELTYVEILKKQEKQRVKDSLHQHHDWLQRLEQRQDRQGKWLLFLVLTLGLSLLINGLLTFSLLS